MDCSSQILSMLIIFILSRPSMAGEYNSLPSELFSSEIRWQLREDSEAISEASRDFGGLVRLTPAAVLYPSSIDDIISLVKQSYNSSAPFGVAAKGRGHSLRGQAMAENGVVVEMSALGNSGNRAGVMVSWSDSFGYYADVGGEQLWIQVLKSTLEYGLAPVSWTDYLYLSVGGTLSNGGISGQAFKYGPQISNVYEMDVITGKGELLTCSKSMNSELFYAVLGGLGQFGIITRARIALQTAPKRVKWVRMLYEDFSSFTRDQEHLISMDKGVDYLEGSVILQQSPLNNWRSSFFSPSNISRIISLLNNKQGLVYCLEAVKYYDDPFSQDQELEQILKGLNFVEGFIFRNEASFVEFLDRVRSGELQLQSQGLWDVPHPWLNLFVPKSQILDFASGVFQSIRRKKMRGPILVYPTRRDKWDERTSAVIPDGDIFYCVGFLYSSGAEEWEILEEENTKTMQFCEEAGIGAKQYLPHYSTMEKWADHFGSKWKGILARKALFDPKNILSPGQRIFSVGPVLDYSQ